MVVQVRVRAFVRRTASQRYDIFRNGDDETLTTSAENLLNEINALPR